MIVFQKFFYILFSLFISIIINTSINAKQDDISVQIDLTQNITDQHFDIIPSSFVLESITYDADIYIQHEELMYLLGLQPKTIISSADLIKACFYLKIKNKFEKITISLHKGIQGYQMHLNLVGRWTFFKVRIEGLLNGKDYYRQFYLMEVGDIFDMQKHVHSLQKIQEALIEEGYLNAVVSDALSYNQKTKTIIVTLFIDKDAQFIIDQLAIKIPDQSDSNNNLKKKIYYNFIRPMRKKHYCQLLINQQIKELKKFLTKKGFFNSIITLNETVSSDDHRVCLLFTITLNQQKKFIFRGNRFFSSQQLFSFISTFGRAIPILPEAVFEQELMREYHHKGFWQSSVVARNENHNTVFSIDEGPRTSINTIQFNNVPTIRWQQLRSFFHVVKGSYYDYETIKNALATIIDFYVHEGFWDAKIVAKEFVPLANNNEYSLHLTIDEGQQRFIKSIIIDQFPLLCASLPYGAINHKIPFDASIITTQRQWLLHYFQQQGYLYAQVEHEIYYENTDATITWHVQGLEKKVTFDRPIIIGDYTFPFNCIMRELQFRVGDVWDKEKLEQSRIHMRDLNIFEAVYIYPYKTSDYLAQKPIIIKLLKDDPFEIRIRAGFQQVSKNLTFRAGSTYKVGASFLYKNITNCGDSLRFDGDITRFYRTIAISYQRPWIFSNPINTQLKGYSNKFIEPVFIGSDKPLYKAIQQGIFLGFDRKWHNAGAGINLGIELMETNDLSLAVARAINFDPFLVDKKIPYFYVEPNILWNSLDNQLNPTKGTLTVISGKAMIPFKNHKTTFLKILAEHSYFLFLKPLILGMRIRIGHIFNQDFSMIMPPERFYLGGENSIRSYQPNFAPPLGSYIDEKGKVQLVPQGGRSMVNVNFEIRFPLWYNFIGAVFQDLGTLIEHSLTEVRGNRFLTATGFGLRYNTPIGPLRFDIGWKWKKADFSESQFACFFTLGQAF